MARQWIRRGDTAPEDGTPVAESNGSVLTEEPTDRTVAVPAIDDETTPPQRIRTGRSDTYEAVGTAPVVTAPVQTAPVAPMAEPVTEPVVAEPADTAVVDPTVTNDGVATDRVATDRVATDSAVDTTTRTAGRSSFVANLGLIVSVVAACGALSGLLAPEGLALAVVGLLISVAGFSAGRRPGVTGSGTATLGVILSLGTIVLAILAMSGDFSWPNSRTDEVKTAHDWLVNHWSWLNRW